MRVRRFAVRASMATAVAMLLIMVGATAALAKPANDDFRRATRIGSLPFADSLDTSKAKRAGDDPTDCGTPNNSVWYEFTASTAVRVGIDTFGSSYPANVGVYTGTQGSLTRVACDSFGTAFMATAGVTYHVMVVSPTPGGGQLTVNVTGQPPPANDDFEGATTIAAFPFRDTQNTIAATSAPDDPTDCGSTSSSVWYQVTPESDATVVVDTTSSEYSADIGVFTGQRGSLSPVACGFRELSFPATAGVTYYLMVAVNNGNGNLVLDVNSVAPPPNDDFGSATVVPALPFTDRVDTRGALTAPDDPGNCGNSHSVWYTLTPTTSQRVDLDTFGSSYGTQIGVFTGARGSLTPVACGGNLGVSFNAAAGVTYSIVVVGDGGDLVFNAEGHLFPPNDDFDGATAITSLPFSDAVDTAAATSAPDDPLDCGETSHSVWYVFTTPADATLSADTAGSSYTPVVAVYTGSRGALTLAACGLQRTTFQATAGVTYHIRVSDSFISTEGGNLAFRFAEAAG
jgi:hypothetical protein